MAGGLQRDAPEEPDTTVALRVAAAMVVNSAAAATGAKGSGEAAGAMERRPDPEDPSRMDEDYDFVDATPPNSPPHKRSRSMFAALTVAGAPPVVPEPATTLLATSTHASAGGVVIVSDTDDEGDL